MSDIVKPCYDPLELVELLKKGLGLSHNLESDEGKSALQAELGLADEDGDRFPDDWEDWRGIPRSDSHKRGRPIGNRLWKAITAICLHQTAAAIQEGHPRIPAIPAHALVTWPGGTKPARAHILQPCTAYMAHAHKLNRFTLGIEISCREPGVIDDASTFWRRKIEKARRQTMEELERDVTDRQLELAVDVCKWWCWIVKENGGRITHVVAHRQGHSSRTGDPGEEIWEGVARPVQRMLELDRADLNHWGSGKPIPDVWSGKNNGIRYR